MEFDTYELSLQYVVYVKTFDTRLENDARNIVKRGAICCRKCKGN